MGLPYAPKCGEFAHFGVVRAPRGSRSPFPDVDAAREGALEILRAAEHRPGIVDRDSVCEAWQILGTTQRSRDTYSSAAYCLRQALVLGCVGRASAVRRTSTLQRVAYLVSDQGDFEQANRVLKVAKVMTVSDWYATGRILVSEGVLLGKMARLDEVRRRLA